MRQKSGKLSLIVTAVVLLLGLTLAHPGYGEPGKTLRAHDIRENIWDSAILSPTNYVMVGDRGKIFRSVDSGKTWREVLSGTRMPLYSVSFPDTKNGWISGKSGLILHTTDGGQTWSKQESDKNKHFFSIDFRDDRHGCAVGDWGAIVVTEDGGATWQDVSLPEDVVLYGVGFTDNQNGWIVGELGRIFRTTDGGTTWSAVQVRQDVESSLYCPVVTSLFCLHIDGDSLYAAGLDGIIIYSKDRGETWHHARSDAQKALYSITVRGDSGWAAGDAGTILQTTDGGKSWHLVDIPEQNKLFWVGTVSLTDSNPEETRGFGAGASGLFFTIRQNNLLWGDGGKSP